MWSFIFSIFIFNYIIGRYHRVYIFEWNIKQLESCLGKLSRQIGTLRGKMHQIGEVISSYRKEIETHNKVIEQAKNMNIYSSVIEQRQRQIDMLSINIIEGEEGYQKWEMLFRVLVKYYDEIVFELSKLQDQVPAFCGKLAQKNIEDSLGAPITQLFASFDINPLASASISVATKRASLSSAVTVKTTLKSKPSPVAR